MTAVTASEGNTIEWNGHKVRYHVYPDGQTEAEKRVYLYVDIIKASGSSILNSFIFRNAYPQFFESKGNNLIGLINETISYTSEIEDPEMDTEYRKVIDNFTTFLKKFTQDAESGNARINDMVDLMIAAIEKGEHSKEHKKLRDDLARAARGAKSSSALLIAMYAMDEAQKRVGKEKFEQFATRLAELNKENKNG